MKLDKTYKQVIDQLSQCADEVECQDVKQTILRMKTLCAKQEERMQRILKLSDRQQMAILKLNEELHAYQNNLEQKVEEEIQKRKQQEELLFEQSRLAAIAEMMDAVAHQWTQPLNMLSMYTYTLSMQAEKDKVVPLPSVQLFKENFAKQIEHMTDTLNNFRSFFRPIEEKQVFYMSEIIQSVLGLLQDDLLKHSIKVNVHQDEDFMLNGNPNEFKHILINMISNAKYAFNQRAQKHREITINILGREKKLEIIDNAGGIPASVLDDVFKMNVTSKKDEGTGIGLYMSQQIAQKHQGVLSAENTDDGAKFTFILNKDPL